MVLAIAMTIVTPIALATDSISIHTLKILLAKYPQWHCQLALFFSLDNAFFGWFIFVVAMVIHREIWGYRTDWNCPYGVYHLLKKFLPLYQSDELIQFESSNNFGFRPRKVEVGCTIPEFQTSYRPSDIIKQNHSSVQT